MRIFHLRISRYLVELSLIRVDVRSSWEGV